VSHSIVVKSFAELAGLFPEEEKLSDTVTVSEAATHSAAPMTDDTDLARLVEDLESAGVALARIIVRDQEERALALRDLERYDALAQLQHDAELTREQARRIRQEAVAFRVRAFGEEARHEAERIAEAAGKAEEFATRRVEAARRDIEQLAADIDLERLLAERQKEQEAEKAKAAAAERAGRLSGALARAKSALEAGRFEEAHAVLGSVVDENPNNAEITSLLDMIIHRETAVKVAAVEDALWLARRTWRHDPEAAIKHLAALDVAGLPVEIGCQVFGAWAQACARLCRQRGLIEPLRYAPTPGRGAILAREQAGAPYTVISALGLDATWQPGNTIGERQLQRARPLR